MDYETLHPLPCLVELVATLLAQALQVRTPACAAVEFSQEFIESVGVQLDGAKGPRSLARAITSGTFVFGSAFEKAGPFMRADLMDRELRPAAADLLLFDVLIDNLDRSAENPNILQTRNELIAIDHGEAFSFLFPIIGGGLFFDEHLVAKHACLPAVRKLGAGCFDDLGRRIASLGDEVLEAIRAATPAVWQAGPAAGKLEVILQTIRERRDTVEAWLPQLEARVFQ